MNNSTSFNRFYQTWLEQLHLLTTNLSGLVSNPPEHHHNYDECARKAVDKVMTHYSELYRAKSEGDALALFAAPWATSLERSLHWVAGFRPTTVFHVIYTESSARFESHVANFLRGRLTGDLGDLTAEQLTRVSELQVETVRAEDEISRRVSAWQEELAGMDWAGARGRGALGGRVERLRSVVETADELRLRTMSVVVGLLSTRQAVEFMLAFSQLLFRIHSWGMQHDSRLPAPA